jgi:lipopolysaccharide/colanic/teichoic acid biosynthesis glycosyltransferase
VPSRRVLSLNRRYYATGVAVDVVAVVTSIALSVLIRFGSLSAFPLSSYTGTWAFLFLGYYTVSIIENLYSVRTTLNRPMLLYRTMRMVFAVTGLFMLTQYLFKGMRPVFIDSRFVVIFNMFASLFIMLFSKLILLPLFFGRLYRGQRRSRSNMLIAGNPDKNNQIAALMRKSAIYSGEERVLQWSEPLPLTSGEIATSITRKVRELGCSGLMLLFDQRHSTDCMAETCVLLSDTDIPFVIYGPEVFSLGYFDPWFSLEDYGALTFLKTTPPEKDLSARRLTDVLLAGIAVVFLSPLLLLTALLVRLSGKGPVLFRQERVGLHLRTFSFLKFRSMRLGTANSNAHQEYFKKYAENKSVNGDGETFKLDQSSRITPVGRVIRKTSIDELPQLINVLRGEMTIVGPRPCIPYELEHYKGWQRRRFGMKPGLTGIWQVYGRSRLPFDKAQFLDFLYTIDASHSLDFRLIMKTIPVVIFGKGGL